MKKDWLFPSGRVKTPGGTWDFYVYLTWAEVLKRWETITWHTSLFLTPWACSGELQSQQNLRALLSKIIPIVHSDLRSLGTWSHNSARCVNFPLLLQDPWESTSSSPSQSTEVNASSGTVSSHSHLPFAPLFPEHKLLRTFFQALSPLSLMF